MFGLSSVHKEKPKSSVNAYGLMMMNIFRRSVLLSIMVSYFVFAEKPYEWADHVMRWVDDLDPDDSDMDTFFDRIVAFVHDVKDEKNYQKDHLVLAPGVLIKSDTVLTSFNAFRNISTFAAERLNVAVVVLLKRTITDWENVNYDLKFCKIACARQVYSDVDDVWFGTDKLHAPMHDLMVLRLEEELETIDSDPALYSFDSYNKTGESTVTVGPIITEIAQRRDKFGTEVKFASLGFKDDPHIWRSFYMRSVYFTTDDNILEDCEAWIPKEWGFFICIRNSHGFEGVGSGAMLFYNDILFGVGAFSLTKGETGILVFTDVRRYDIHISKACTASEQKEMATRRMEKRALEVPTTMEECATTTVEEFTNTTIEELNTTIMQELAIQTMVKPETTTMIESTVGKRPTSKIMKMPSATMQKHITTTIEEPISATMKKPARSSF